MTDQFKTVSPETLDSNVFRLIGNEWMLITGGNLSSFNTMTASWGFMGILWNKPISVCFIRPQRYTLGFVETSDHFTLSFFEEKYRKMLSFCGSRSGRDCDKVKETGLIPIETPIGNISFSQARLILECKKLYTDTLQEKNFIVKDLIEKNYSDKDFHKFFLGEVINVYKKSG